jgi:HEAT repeat protein
MTGKQIVVALFILAAVAAAVIIIPKTKQPGRPLKPDEQDPPKKQIGEDLIDKAGRVPSIEERKRPKLIAPGRPMELVIWAVDSPTPYLSAEAVEVAGRLEADWAERLVEKALRKDDDGDFDDTDLATRALYVKALRGDKGLLDDLIAILRLEEDDWEIQMWCGRTLGLIPGDDSLAKLLTMVYREDEDEEATWDAVWAAGRHDSPLVKGSIKQLLDHSDDDFVTFAAGALLKFGDADAKKMVDKHFANYDESDWDEEYLANGLGMPGSAAAVPYLVNLTGGEDRGEDLRVLAARSLGRTGAKEAIEPLKNLLGDEDNDVQVVAAAALAREFGKDDGAPILAERIRSRIDPEICLEAMKALLELNREEDLKLWQEVFDRNTQKEDELILKLWAGYGLLRH